MIPFMCQALDAHIDDHFQKNWPERNSPDRIDITPKQFECLCEELKALIPKWKTETHSIPMYRGIPLRINP